MSPDDRHVNPGADVEREEALRNRDDAAWIDHPEWWNVPGSLELATMEWLEGKPAPIGRRVLHPGIPELQGKALPVAHPKHGAGVVLNMQVAPWYTVYAGNVFNETFVRTLIALSHLGADPARFEISLPVVGRYESAEAMVADGWRVD